jgi:hypothetical protein
MYCLYGARCLFVLCFFLCAYIFNFKINSQFTIYKFRSTAEQMPDPVPSYIDWKTSDNVNANQVDDHAGDAHAVDANVVVESDVAEDTMVDVHDNANTSDTTHTTLHGDGELESSGIFYL